MTIMSLHVWGLRSQGRSRRMALVASAVLACDPAGAVALDPAACDKARYDQLELSDVPKLMARGASWAKDNATAAQMKRVARWIELEEAIQFRCGQVRMTPGTERAAAAAEALEAPPPAVVAPAPSGAGEPAEVSVKPKTKPKPKPKTPDTASDSSNDPVARSSDATTVKAPAPAPAPQRKKPVPAETAPAPSARTE